MGMYEWPPMVVNTPAARAITDPPMSSAAVFKDWEKLIEERNQYFLRNNYEFRNLCSFLPPARKEFIYFCINLLALNLGNTFINLYEEVIKLLIQFFFYFLKDKMKLTIKLLQINQRFLIVKPR